LKRNITSLVEHHKVCNGKKRYKQTTLTYHKEYPWPRMIPLETCKSKHETLLALSKNLACLNLYNWNQKCPLTKSNYEYSWNMSISSPTLPIKSTSHHVLHPLPKPHRNHAILRDLFRRLRPIVHSPCDFAKVRLP